MTDMNIQAIILTTVSSVLSLVVAVYTLLQSISGSYEENNSHEEWFYTFQMAPLIFVHFAWTTFPSRQSLILSNSWVSQADDKISILK